MSTPPTPLPALSALSAPATDSPDVSPPTGDVAVRAIDAVFDALLADILRGTYEPGKRLPAERELSRTLGASRPTLREALRRLGEWHMVEPRRGSGVVVRPMREWSLDVLPAYLRFGAPGPGRPSSARILLDVVTMRRALLTSVIAMIGDRAAGASLETARSALARAWAARRDPLMFPRYDLDVLRCVIEACGLMPGLWLLNQMSNVYLDVVRYVGPASLPSDDYLDAYSAMFAALERGDAKLAATTLDAWFEKSDRAVVNALQGMA